ncbi:MAG: hypothetical protein M3083_05875 [Actinomycetota bacterium]|nr:hypothetical protein [Actinomycetota bacterium]MDQ6946795.1 hypothetical protein [Actinomycetota bacterium]
MALVWGTRLSETGVPPCVRVVEVGTVPKLELGVDPAAEEELPENIEVEVVDVEVVEIEVLDVVVDETVVVDCDTVEVPPQAVKKTISSAGATNFTPSECHSYRCLPNISPPEIPLPEERTIARE